MEGGREVEGFWGEWCPFLGDARWSGLGHEGWRSDADGKLQLGHGHHGDDEYEYEIHHFEKYHDESKSSPSRCKAVVLKAIPTRVLIHRAYVHQRPNPVRLDTREEDLTHPEDIAHFAKHDALEDAAERQEQLDRMPIVEQNIPQKFRRVP